MKNINLKSISLDELIDEMVLSNLNPNNFLKEAITLKRLDIVKVLFEYGATTETLYTPNEEDKFLESCSKDLAEYLSQYRQQFNKKELETCFDEIARSLYQIDYGRYTNRNYQFNHIGKTCHWSIGLTVREADEERFLTLVNQMCDIEPWNDRHQHIDINRTDGFALISTVVHDQIEGDIDPEYISPNIKASLNLYLVNKYELKSFLGELSFKGEEMLGIVEFDKPTLFKLDGSVDFKIFDHMKETVSQNYKNR